MKLNGVVILDDVEIKGSTPGGIAADRRALRGGIDADGVDFKLRVRRRPHHADARIA